jgi:ubiquinone/menaquinone biosynthesis C-methylase UbiE
MLRRVTRRRCCGSPPLAAQKDDVADSLTARCGHRSGVTVSSLALMRFLESAPARYDYGIRVLTLGAVSRLQDVLAEAAASSPGCRVLEIGCGTGAVTERLVARGARVTALDQNPAMLERAVARLAGSAPGAVTWMERTASEIDGLAQEEFDAVVASLVLSEMSRGERRFVLREAARRLRVGGLLVVGDEVVPRSPWKRAVHKALRAPQALLGWLLADSVSRPLLDLAAEIREAGLRIQSERRWLLESLSVVVAERPP